MARKVMATAKDLARKAFIDGVIIGMTSEVENLSREDQAKLNERFENWWSEWYGDKHQQCFYHIHSVFIDFKRYIQAE